jgi:hypothetical protein
MAKIIEQISPTSWSVTEDIGPATTKYMVYDDDPNINKYVHDFGRLSVSDTDSIKESLDIRNGLQGPAGPAGATGATGSGGGVSSADDMLLAFINAAEQSNEFVMAFQKFLESLGVTLGGPRQL